MYVSFKHENGSWYQLWITKGVNGYAVHANYDKTGSMLPTNNEWWEEFYGRFNVSALTTQEALELFMALVSKRIEHGYEIEAIGPVAVYKSKQKEVEQEVAQ